MGRLETDKIPPIFSNDFVVRVNSTYLSRENKKFKSLLTYSLYFKTSKK